MKEVLRNRCARLMVTREEVERLPLPGPVLEDLRREFDEVPGDAHAGERLHLDLAEHVVQEVSELVEDRRDLVVGEQRLAAADGRREVAAHQAEVRGERAVGARCDHRDVGPALAVLALHGHIGGLARGAHLF